MRPSLGVYPLFISIGSVASILFTPAIPAIQDHFKINSNAVQATVSFFLAGYAFCQLIYGPITNCIGRKPALYLAFLIGIAGSLLSIIAGSIHNFPLFLVARLITALGTGGGLTLALTIINDVYTYEESRRVIPLATLSFAVFPAISIFLGGYFVQTWGWESCFYILTLYIFLAFVISMRMPETSQRVNLRPLSLREVLNQYLSVGKNLSLWAYGGIWGLCTAVPYLFATTAPILSITHLGASPKLFGTYNLLGSVGMALGTLSTRKLALFFPARKVMTFGFVILGTAVSMLLFFQQIEHLTLNTLFFPMTLFYLGMPLVFTNASALAMQGAANKGAASALISFINLACPVFLFLMTHLFVPHVENFLPQIFSFLVISMIILMLSNPASPQTAS